MKKIPLLTLFLTFYIIAFGQNNKPYTSFEEASKEPEKVEWLDLKYCLEKIGLQVYRKN